MKIVSIVIMVFIVLGGVIFIIAGGKRTNVILHSFSISKDGTNITLHIEIAGSVGYTRKLKVKQSGNSKYVTFYSTYGINMPIGAKDTFKIELNPSCEEIYFYEGNGEYRLVLQKDKNTNEWRIESK